MSEGLKANGIPHAYDVVTGVEQYRNLLEKHRPAILIHFGHGSYNKHDDIGYLEIGNERTKVWDLN
jgi:hypothetical protein